MSVQAHWFRLYHDVLRDTKFDLPWWGDRQFWIWTGLLLLASESSRRGTVTFYMSKMDAMDQLKKTLRSGLSRDEIVTCVTHLEKTGCLKTLCSNPGRTVLQVCHWKRRQTYKPSDSPDNAAERQRRHREKATASGDVTPSSRVTSRPVTPNVTPPRTEQNRTEQNRADQRGVTTANGSGVFSSQGDGPGGNGKGGEPAAVHLDHIRQLKANPAKWDALPEHTRAKYERTIAEAEGAAP